jgi:small-conductance mechanosensitive channel
MDEYLKREYLGNTVLHYLIALGIALVGTLVVRLLKRIILGRLEKWAKATETQADDFIIESIARFGIPALHYFVIYSAINFLTLHPKTETVVNIATAMVITYLIIRLVSSTILHLLKSYILKQERGEEKLNQMGGLIIIINIIVWVLGILFLLSNLHYDVTAIVAGLGIGGIAIALAAQNILGDLFNYFVIFFDRPFEVGDFIVVDDKQGTIEYIGLKTTRIRSLTGEQIIIGNANLTSARIHNYKRMSRRRVIFNIDVEYNTPVDTLKGIPDLLAQIIEKQDLVNLDRSHFSRLAESSFKFEVVYFVNAPEMNTYMDIQQRINFAICEEFNRRGIRFAFPSRTIYLDESISKNFPSTLKEK